MHARRLLHVLFPCLAVAVAAMASPTDAAWPNAGEPSAHVVPAAQIPELKAAATPVSLDGQTLTLEAALTRDFMPIAPPGGRPLLAVLTLHTRDGAPVSGALKAEAAWIVKGDQAWVVGPLEQQSSGGSSAPRLVARGGPKWEPGSHVDVVVRLRSAAGQTALLALRGATIKRSE
jgi:hypothetical protein